MKTTLNKLICLLICIGFVSISPAQNDLTTNQWQEDLHFLQRTVHRNHPFLFQKITQKAWDAEVDKLYEQIPYLAPHEIAIGLTRMVSLFEYGHTQIPFRTIASDGVLGVNLYYFEDGIYIEGVQKGNEKALGAKVIKVGGMPVAEALKAIRPVVPAENDQYFKAYGLRFLTVPTVLHAQGVIPELNQTVQMTLEKEGKQFEHRFTTIPLSALSEDYGFTTANAQWVSARNQSETPLFLKHLEDRLYYFEYLAASKTIYVRQSSVFNDEKESLADFYTRLFNFIDSNAVDKLVYDVRLNGGGNNFNNKQLIKNIMARPKINTQGKFFFIIGRYTFSAAQNLTNEIEKYTEAILIGEPTAENKNFYGDAKRVRLPNSKINAYLSYAWWQDKAPGNTEEWTVPHLARAMTFDEYINNTDQVLAKALNYTETPFIMDPMAHLKTLFAAGNFKEVKRIATQMATDPAYSYYNFEKDFGAEGYRLFSSGATEGGLFILELVADLYSSSVGARYNLATALEKEQQIEKAKASYQKVIQLAPNKPLGIAAKKKLERLNKQ